MFTSYAQSVAYAAAVAAAADEHFHERSLSVVAAAVVVFES
jgi:hypothetical protein